MDVERDLYFGDEPEDEANQEDKAEPDPAIVARLDQEEAAFAAEKEKWLHTYGFDHDCTCSQDYSAGNTTEVTYCFMRLTNQALRRAAEATMEVGMLNKMVSRMVQISNDLITMMEELGHTDELQKYFSGEDDIVPEEVETTDLDSEFEQMLLLAEETEDDDDGLALA